MGCVVNGPGEASDADLGVAGAKDECAIFVKGKIIKKVKKEEVETAVKKAYENNEVTMSKIVLRPDGTAYYKILEESGVYGIGFERNGCMCRYAQRL